MKCKSDLGIVPGGSSLPLSLLEVFLLLSSPSTGLKRGLKIIMQDGVPAFVQHILKRHFLLISTGAMSVFLRDIN